MFLKSFHKDEKGSLPGAIIIIVLLGIISAMIATVSMSAINITKTMDDVSQSRINSDSAVDIALASLYDNACEYGAEPRSETVEEADVGIFYNLEFVWETEDRNTATCLTADIITIIATGYSDSNKENGFTQTVSFEYIPGELGVTMMVPETAIYATQNLTAPKLIIESAESNPSKVSIIVEKGNYTCVANSSIQGDLIVQNGNIELNSNCRIYGNLYVNGNISSFSSGAQIHGDVYALGTGRLPVSNYVDLINGNVYTNGYLVLSNGTITGNVISTNKVSRSEISGIRVGGNMSLNSSVSSNNAQIGGSLSIAGENSRFYNTKIGGTLYNSGSFNSEAQGFLLGGSLFSSSTKTISIRPDSVINGDVISAGPVKAAWGTLNINGTLKQNQTGVSVPEPLTFDTPEELINKHKWKDYRFDESLWDVNSYNIVKATCDYQNNATARTELMSRKGHTILDARHCGTLRMYGITMDLQGDLTIVGNAMNINNSKWHSGDGLNKTLNIIQEDLVEDNVPTCSGGTIDAYNISLSENVGGFIYSPCNVAFGSSSADAFWRGALYIGGKISVGGSNPKLEFIAVNEPPKFSTGPITDLDKAIIGKKISSRNE